MAFAAESYVRTALQKPQIQKIREMAKEELEKAIRAKGKNPEDYIITDILPKDDLGLANNEWKHTFSAAYTEETWINKTLDDDVFMTFYGYANASAVPKTLYVKYMRGASTEKVFHVQHVYTQMEPIAYHEPITYSESDTLKVLLYGNATGEDYPILLGLVAMPRSKRITK